MSNLAHNLKVAAACKERFSRDGILNRINGCDVSSDTWFNTCSPHDGSIVARVAKASAADVDRAAVAAKAAFPAWRDLNDDARMALLHAIADGIEAQAEEIAVAEAFDTGQPMRFMINTAARGAEHFRYFAGLVPAARRSSSVSDATHTHANLRSPIGPVGVISAWNTPFILATMKISAALAAGCTLVHKPAELAPLTSRLLIEIAESAGIPASVWNLVNGTGEEVGRALTEHPEIRAIAFVGESQTGSAVVRQASGTLKRLQLELGGKNPCIVFDDADLDRALDAAILMIFALNGQRCTSSSRLFLQRSIHDAFVEKLQDRVARLKIGNPLDPLTDIGPLISADHREKVLSYSQIAQQDGATIAAGGHAIDGPGYYVEPTLYSHATNQMRIAQDEIFGPNLTIIPFDSEAEALQMANETVFGLAAYIWTTDTDRAGRLSRAIEAGVVWVNSENLRHLPSPFGGVKASGIGRDGGDWSLDFHMEHKHIGIASGDHPITRLGD